MMKDGGVELVIIDTAPSAWNDVGDVMAAADLVLVPVIPSPTIFGPSVERSI